MTVIVVVGTQWGDEGKGKIVDFLAKDFDIVARFQGGPNAGHTVVVGDKTFKLHHIPSGIIQGKEVMLGNGMVIDPVSALKEIKDLEKAGIKLPPITISNRAHVILDKHREIDVKDTKIGTTKKGIGPTYGDKVARTGLRIEDVLDKYPDLEKYVGDVSLKINKAIDSGRNILLEGSQGTQLDIDHGTYPYVTSSNTIAGAACTGLGIGPTKIDKVIGVTKAYTTRVGEGPFPTELKDDAGKHLQEKGKEFGTTTGRPRRCGWFDSVVVKYAIRVNGINEIALTKLDVLSGLDKLKVCISYESDKPVYQKVKGFSAEDWHNIAVSGYKALPETAKTYVETLEKLLDTKIAIIGTGPARSDTFIKE